MADIRRSDSSGWVDTDSAGDIESIPDEHGVAKRQICGPIG